MRTCSEIVDHIVRARQAMRRAGFTNDTMPNLLIELSRSDFDHVTRDLTLLTLVERSAGEMDMRRGEIRIHGAVVRSVR